MPTPHALFILSIPNSVQQPGSLSHGWHPQGLQRCFIGCREVNKLTNSAYGGRVVRFSNNGRGLDHLTSDIRPSMDVLRLFVVRDPGSHQCDGIRPLWILTWNCSLLVDPWSLPSPGANSNQQSLDVGPRCYSLYSRRNVSLDWTVFGTLETRAETL